MPEGHRCEKPSPYPASLPIVAHHDRELGVAGRGLVLDVAGDADLKLSALNQRGRDQRELTLGVDVCETLELLERWVPG